MKCPKLDFRDFNNVFLLLFIYLFIFYYTVHTRHIIVISIRPSMLLLFLSLFESCFVFRIIIIIMTQRKGSLSLLLLLLLLFFNCTNFRIDSRVRVQADVHPPELPSFSHPVSLLRNLSVCFES